MKKILTILTTLFLFSCNNKEKDIVFYLQTESNLCNSNHLEVNLDKLTVINCDEEKQFKSLLNLCNYLNKFDIIDYTTNQQITEDIYLEFEKYIINTLKD